MTNDSTRRFGRYELIAHLGQGAMVDAYLARVADDNARDRSGTRPPADLALPVVVKKILPALLVEEAFVQAYLGDARTAAQLRHDNIARLLDQGYTAGEYYVVQEYLDGENLGTILQEVRSAGLFMPPLVAAGIALQMCRGLCHAHRFETRSGDPVEILHLDVSPTNVFVLYDGQVKLTDFCVARTARQFSHLSTGMLKSKLPYMSPEQIMNLSLDPRTDVYACGVVLWEMLTGRQLLLSSSGDEAPPPMAINPGVSKELNDFTLRALRISRELRFPDMGKMTAALEALLEPAREASDRQAISNYMHEVFDAYMVAKRDRVEQAQNMELDLEDALFGDMWLEKSDAALQPLSGDTFSPPGDVALVVDGSDEGEPVELAKQLEPTDRYRVRASQAISIPSSGGADAYPGPGQGERSSADGAWSLVAPGPPAQEAVRPRSLPPIVLAPDRKWQRLGIVAAAALVGLIALFLTRQPLTPLQEALDPAALNAAANDPDAGGHLGAPAASAVPDAGAGEAAPDATTATAAKPHPAPSTSATSVASRIEAPRQPEVAPPAPATPPPRRPPPPAPPRSVARPQAPSPPAPAVDPPEVEGRGGVAGPMEPPATPEPPPATVAAPAPSADPEIIPPQEPQTDEAPAPPAPPPAVTPATGRLRLATTPWTTVHSGDRKLGVTPLVDIELPAGSQVLRLTNEGKGIDVEITVEIEAGRTTVKALTL